MSSELPKAYEPSLIEEKWAKFWVEEGLFHVATPPEGEAPARPFVQLLPPPNVTGRLHMGHMLNQTEMDILTRWHRMLGETAVWVPGTDHAGIATQMMVERQLAAENGLGRAEMGREAFTERVWQWKRQYGGAITEQMQRLGASVDWSREYFTMDERLSRAVKEAFVRLWEQGLIYRGAYIVNWDPVLATAVSDLEVVHEERAGKLYYVCYRLAEGSPLADGRDSITIATTRPETMLGDVAVAVNPEDERYKEFIGKRLVLPLSAVAGGQAREIPVVGDAWANPEFGTGAVKVTPAHDPNDFAIGQRHGLAQLSIMDEHARIRLEGSPYDGQDRFVAREHIVEDLRASGALVEIKDHVHAIALSQRTGEVIEPRLSMQWFLNVTTSHAAGGESIAAKAIEAVDKGYIRFTPENYKRTYDEWMRNIHDWCLSRQLWWGHRIPAWHCGQCRGVTVARETPKACVHCGAEELTQETDVLDTWFSSGLLPFTVFGWPGEAGKPTADLAAFYPTDLLVTGFDILFFWVARMIMLGCHFMLDVPMPDGSPRTLKDAVPFREVYIHALVRDAERQKMSKTKGNVIDPIGIVTKYGTDAVRFTLASQASPGTDIAFNEARTEGYRAFANKIWNAARFLQMQIERGHEAGYSTSLEVNVLPESTPLETRWIYARLSAVCEEAARALKSYRFDEAANAIYQFFWGEFCDWYVELVKLRLDFTAPKNDTAALTLNALASVFEAALRLLSPFMPFLTEELWHALYASIGERVPARSIALTRYPQASDFVRDTGSEAGMRRIQDLIAAVRARRKEIGVPEKDFVPILAVWDARSGTGSTKPAINNVYKENADMIARLARVSGIDDKNLDFLESTPELGWVQALGPLFAVLYEKQIDAAAERERLLKELAKYDKGLQAAERQLGNEGFVAKAPAHIVEGLKRQAAETRTLKEKAEAALAALPAE